MSAGSGGESAGTATFWRVLAALVAVRVVYALGAPLDLVGDEAYYWDWGRNPAWGYFSKPPMIAWVMGVAGAVAGSSDGVLRLFAVAGGTVSLVFGYLLARRLAGERVALGFGLAAALAPASVAQNLILTIDGPLLVCWTGALWAFWRWVEAETPGGRWKFGLTVVAFLALGHLSKQMMLVFPLLAGLFLAQEGELRGRLRSPWVWLGVGGSLLSLVPTLVWNAGNEWITFHHTLHHFESKPVTLGAVVGREVELLGSLVGLTGPVIAVLAGWALVRGARDWRGLSREERFLWLFSGPALAVMFALCLRQRINANWPAVFLPCALLLAAMQAEKAAAQAGKAGRWLSRWWDRGLGVSGGLSLAVYLAPLLVWAAGTQGGEWDVTRRLRGWSELGREVSARLEAVPRPEETFLLTVGHRYLTSQLAFYVEGQPRVWRWNESGEVESQYDLWPAYTTQGGRDALVVVDPGFAGLPEGLPEQFAEWVELESIRVPLGAGEAREYRVFRGRELRGAGKEANRGGR